MKKVYLFILAIIVLLISAGCSTTPEPDKIGYMNMEVVLDTSQRAQQLSQELVDIGNDLELKYNEKQNEITDDENQEDELDKISQEYLENKQRLEVLLNQEINEIIAEIAEEKNISTVLYYETVYYGGIDITEEVVSILDERYIEGGDANNE